MGPQFPIRIIFDDGDCEIIETPEALLEKIDSIDTTNPANRLIMRDERDRNLRVEIYCGRVIALEVLNEK